MQARTKYETVRREDYVRGPPASHLRHWQVTARGQLLTVKCYEPRAYWALMCRGRIQGFSPGSRLRILKLLATIDPECVMPASFITVTWPDGRRPGYRDVTRAKQVFWRSLEKIAGPTTAVWRVEWELRKSGKHKGKPMPHIHFVAFKIPFIHYSRINELWKRAIRKTSYVRTEIKPLKSAKQGFAYIAKYVAKKQPSTSLVYAAYLNKSQGRCWGVLRPRGLKRSPAESARTYDQDFIESLRTLCERQWPDLTKKQSNSWTIFMKRPERLLALLGMTKGS